ncbi:hypothetical protein G3578_09110 [Brevibacillus sp. SYP-B805]|uniref:hypothetical protein n=1 Tax=Brevibacillus sp. SYP-B805 TaxID=1578199 RepID=UPI0013EAEFB6|nr:hypothetical protein [Brevibacillus sp. SYP-B805]NGQ95312.1 hypothetical protein [Brevibacillus sp. SYP-B805]
MLHNLAGGRLDAPFYPTKFNDHFVGRQVELAAAGVVSDSFHLDYDTEFVAIHVKAETLYAEDYWELIVGGDKLVETVHTLDWEEGLQLMVAHPVKAGEVFHFTFHGVAPNNVTVTYHFLK